MTGPFVKKSKGDKTTMKKKTSRKLQLQRETLQQLAIDALALAEGGQAPVRTVVLPTDACPVATGG